MSIEAYTKREEILDLREKLIEAEYQRLNGAKTITEGELDKLLEYLIDGTTRS